MGTSITGRLRSTNEDLARAVLSLAIDAGIPTEEWTADPRTREAVELLARIDPDWGSMITTARTEARYR